MFKICFDGVRLCYFTHLYCMSDLRAWSLSSISYKKAENWIIHWSNKLKLKLVSNWSPLAAHRVFHHRKVMENPVNAI